MNSFEEVGKKTRNSSEDEIVNVNFLYDDIVHAQQNTIDSSIQPAKFFCSLHSQQYLYPHSENCVAAPASRREYKEYITTNITRTILLLTPYTSN